MNPNGYIWLEGWFDGLANVASKALISFGSSHGKWGVLTPCVDTILMSTAQKFRCLRSVSAFRDDGVVAVELSWDI
jgi:hypothetical protein